MACTRQQLNAFLDALLTPARFEDYCPNGLQVEGREEVHHLVTGVTAVRRCFRLPAKGVRMPFWFTMGIFGVGRIRVSLG